MAMAQFLRSRIIIFTLSFCILFANGLMVDVESSACFGLTVNERARLHFSAEVISESPPLTSLTLLDHFVAAASRRPRNESVLFEETQISTARFEVSALRSGLHELCFEAEVPTTVSFDFWVGDGWKGKANGGATNGAREAREDPLRVVVADLAEGVLTLSQSQDFARERERTLRSTVEGTSSRVIVSSIFEAIAVAVLSITQVVVMKRFFEVKQIM